jgi:esterase/lipase superfamily enzyme
MAWLVIAMTPALALAATPLRLQLTPDGSAIPPGDLLEIEVLFFPGETELTLEVRAFRVLEIPAYKAISIASRSKTARDERGNYLLTAKIVKPKDARLAKSSLAIPYAHLDLARGMHGLAYEITGRIGKEIDFVRATQVDYVIVSNKVRTEMRLEKEKVQVSAKREKQQINIVKDGKLTTADTEIEVKQSNYDHSTERVKVSIPGEFQRPMLAREMPISPDENDDTPWEALPSGGTAWDSLDKFEPKSKRTILFATNRTVENPKLLSSVRFGKDAADVSYGAALVNIPIETHRKGQLEVPGWWNARDPRKHFLVESLSEFTLAEFQKAAAGDCLLFIHGFNTNFDFAVLRTAQLVHDLQFPGQGIAFSWPSAGSTSSYFLDEKKAERSIVALVEVFEKLLAVEPEKSPRKIHVIAHSMGNRVFMNAIRQYELKHPKSRPFIGHVALAAPDVDGASFAALLPSVQRLAGHVTLYYCSSDRALVASRTVHLNKPVGLGPWFAEGVETVNADNANTEMLGHGYYASSHPLLIDLRLLLVYGEPADKRLPPLTPKTMVLGYPHWAFSPAR